MARTTLQTKLKKIAARVTQASTLGLVVLGLTPAEPARGEPDRTPVPERIDRIRTALDERSPSPLGTVAGVVTPGPQDPDEEKKPPGWDDWNDWNDWSDF